MPESDNDKRPVVYPRPKAPEELPRVPKSTYKDYQHMRITDKKDGNNGPNLQ